MSVATDPFVAEAAAIAAAHRDPVRHRAAKRFEQRREDIIAAAAVVFNRHGKVGGSLREVAEQLGLTTTSINYYFATKDELATECLTRSIELIKIITAGCAHLSETRHRVAALFYGFIDIQRRQRQGFHPTMIVLSEVLAMGEPHAAPLRERYNQMFKRLRALLHPGDAVAGDRRAANAHTHLVLSLLLWMTAWLHRFDDGALAHVAAAASDIVTGGLAARPMRAIWRTVPEPPAPPDADPRARFLRAAILLINQSGYHGASVDRIAAHLNLTKGAFYHHLEAKDDIVLECFQRTLDVMNSHLDVALRAKGDGARRLHAFCTGLVRVQLEPGQQLLRTSALQAVPLLLRRELLTAFDGFSAALAGLIETGIADGSIRAVDPVIAAEMVSALVNSASEITRWIPNADGALVSQHFIRPLFNGLATI